MSSEIIYLSNLSRDRIRLPNYVELLDVCKFAGQDSALVRSMIGNSEVVFLDDTSAWLYPVLRQVSIDLKIVLLLAGSQQMLAAFTHGLPEIEGYKSAYRHRFPAIGLSNGIFCHPNTFLVVEDSFAQKVRSFTGVEPSDFYSRNLFSVRSSQNYVPLVIQAGSFELLFEHLFPLDFTSSSLTKAALSGILSKVLTPNTQHTHSKATLTRIKLARRGLLVRGAAAVEGLPVDKYGSQRTSLVLTDVLDGETKYSYPLGLTPSDLLKVESDFNFGFEYSGFENLSGRSIPYSDLPDGSFKVSIKITRIEGTFNIDCFDCDLDSLPSKITDTAIAKFRRDAGRIFFDKYKYSQLPLGAPVKKLPSDVVIYEMEGGETYGFRSPSSANAGASDLIKVLRNSNLVRPPGRYFLQALNSVTLERAPIHGFMGKKLSVLHEHSLSRPFCFAGVSLRDVLNSTAFTLRFGGGEDGLHCYETMSDFIKAIDSGEFVLSTVSPVVFFNLNEEAFSENVSPIDLDRFGFRETRKLVPVSELIQRIKEHSVEGRYRAVFVDAPPASELVDGDLRRPFAAEGKILYEASSTARDEAVAELPYLQVLRMSSNYRANIQAKICSDPYAYEEHFYHDLFNEVSELLEIHPRWR